MNVLLSIALLFAFTVTSVKAQEVTVEPTGDPTKGLRDLKEHSYKQGGSVYAMSPDEFNNLYLVWPVQLADDARRASPEQRRKMILDYYGLFNLPGKTEQDLDAPPMGWIAAKKGPVWEASCLMCHSGPVKTWENGKLVDRIQIGIANRQFDLNSLLEDRYALARKYPEVSKIPLIRWLTFKSSWEKFKDSIASKSRGTFNLQQGVALNLSIRKDRSLELDWAKVAEVLLLGKTPEVGPVADLDVPPWWNVREKTHLYSAGFAPKAPRSLATSFLSINNRPSEWEKADGADLLAYIESVKPPQYIFNLNNAEVAQGRSLFNQSCARCHGSYESPEHPNYSMRRIPFRVIGTDPNAGQPWGLAFRQKWANSWLGNYGTSDAQVNPTGYVAPPLKGIWATAPYLHNGSVPRLSDVLMIKKSADGSWVDLDQRPEIWKAVWAGYDEIGVGLLIETNKPETALTAHDQRMWFDSRLASNGKSNQGHSGAPFFTYQLEQRLLTTTERGLILEYLKTL